ncbi:hypothetical protein POJ06DRAFT_228612 [Lipomyces tetrasporus]|uniref:Uncharacterized protein n=1 Tax=Lipomyces tetrasporus TaxID=54092 RepID=A0AAD7QL07_9ASCO|nr:uncharacterized protein POJ06DRAFT_228612 [Lipomyces tetrasporus]KAJ8097227.1 hypothetical protein POJ06DRAFT_228612 [Lipomyces tetrasporus]
MSYVLRAILIFLAFSYSTAAEGYISSTTLCLFKGHPKHSPTDTIFWVEQKGTKHIMPFYTMSELEFSDVKSIKVALKDGSMGDALLYLYHNRELVNQNVTFVNYDKSAYHFSGSEKLDLEKYREVGGGKVIVDFGSCVKPEYNWEYTPSRTEATIAGYVKRLQRNNFP